VKVNIGQLSVNERARVALHPPELCALTEKVNVPATDDNPLITPVDGLSENPLGKLPCTRENV
jgi:hypothetical protein